MKSNRLRLLCSLLLASLACLSTSQAQTAAQDGFRPLFNGENLDNWNLKIRSGDASKVFTVDPAAKVVHVFRDFADGHELDTGKNDTHGLMYTKEKFSRYIFRFEYKWGTKRLNNFAQFQYDAGMYYHVYDDAIWPKGIEYQVRFNHVTGHNHTGDYWASGTSFQWYAGDDGQFQLPGQGGRLVNRKSGEHRGLKTAPFHALDGEWNHCEVIVMGDHYSIHKLNGVIVNLATGLSVKEGIIGLQSETAEIFYRNIEIKEFDKDLPIENFLK